MSTVNKYITTEMASYLYPSESLSAECFCFILSAVHLLMHSKKSSLKDTVDTLSTKFFPFTL